MRNIKTYKMFEAKNTGQLTPEQVKWLDECTKDTKGTWSVNPQTGLVDVDGGFEAYGTGLNGVRFGKIKGNFTVMGKPNRNINILTSLRGAPRELRGSFNTNNLDLLNFGPIEGLPDVHRGFESYDPTTGSGAIEENLIDENIIRITSLEGVPYEVEGDFDCSGNKLTSLKGAPQKVGGNFDCSDNNLTSLKGAPQRVGGDFYCFSNKLTSLVGAPQEVEMGFYCSGNKLTSLEGAPQRVLGDFWCSDNNLTSLIGAPQEVEGGFDCRNNNLTSLKGAPRKVGGGFYCDAFDTRDWGLKGWLKLLESGEERARLILPILPESEIDKWMKKHPLDLDLLDGHPEIKKGVLARTGLRDTSSIARNMRRGTI